MLRAPLTVALTDHVDPATPLEAAGYIAAIVLWLAGVVLIVVRKLRASR
jgi:hypothetical protein